MNSSFNLIDEPWIRVRRLDGATAEVSLREVFADADQLRTLAGDLATQDAAILRLLLAIFHRALPHHDTAQRALEVWGHLWFNRGRMPTKLINEYLDQWRHRFDLFDSEAPFMQVAGLHTAKHEDFGLERLVADVPTGEQFFTTRAGSGLQAISTAEAARWLVHCHAFDVSGIKSGAVGDPRVKGGKGYPIGCGWTGQIGLITAEGDTLAETLLLNLVLVDDADDDAVIESGVPIWERAAHGPSIDSEHEYPNSIIDTLVWQSRRIRLVGCERQITRVLICNGDPFTPQNRHRLEAATAWRRSEPQEKKLGLATVYMPRQHQLDRALWRGLEPLLASHISTTEGSIPSHISPGLIRWLAIARSSGVLDTTHPVRIRATGFAYGSNNSVVDGLMDDAVLVHVDVLSDPQLADLAVEAVRHADGAVRALADLGGDLARAAGGEPDGPRGRAYDAGYIALDRAYRTWLASLQADSDVVARLVSWDAAVDRLLYPVSAQLVKDAGRPAFVGRMVDRGGKRVLLDSGQAQLDYRRRISAALPQSATDREPVPATHSGRNAT